MISEQTSLIHKGIFTSYSANKSPTLAYLALLRLSFSVFSRLCQIRIKQTLRLLGATLWFFLFLQLLKFDSGCQTQTSTLPFFTSKREHLQFPDIFNDPLVRCTQSDRGARQTQCIQVPAESEMSGEIQSITSARWWINDAIFFSIHQGPLGASYIVTQRATVHTSIFAIQ